RVIGPAIAALLMSRGMTTSQMLLINAVTFLFVIVALLRVHFPRQRRLTDARGLRNVLAGVQIARHRTIVGRCLLAMAAFSFVCIPWIGLFPSVVRLNFDIDPRGSTYKWLYAVWGVGALSGALLVGTLLSQVSKTRLVRPAFLLFACALAVFATLRNVAVAFPVVFVVGMAYFALATSLLTVIQQNLAGNERARVMSLWFMAFGGTASVSNLVFAPVVDSLGARPVLALSSIGAVALAIWANPRAPGLITLADQNQPAVAVEDPQA
ncbi:MAG TPA: MFS transporter, partial [Ilumatobacteraceae bacterium]|nr:MFS transporter [Ilumatobacteraceae bacterium]